MPNKTDSICWLVNHIFVSVNYPDVAVEDIWTIVSSLIDFYEKEEPAHREKVLYDLRAVVKAMLSAEKQEED